MRKLPSSILLLAFSLLLSFVTTLADDQPRRDDPDDYGLFETEYRWIEIEDIGQQLDELRVNGLQGPFDIGFEFTFFGRLCDEFYVSANGFIGFGPAANYGRQENVELPAPPPPNNIIALYWKGFDPEAFWADGAVYYGIRDGRLVIQFQDYAELNQDGIDPENTITMQVVLEPDGDIILQYARVGEEFDLTVGTVGVEGPRGEAGRTFRYDGEGVEIGAETAYLISVHGPGNFLVWDGGGNSLSGDAQEAALESLGHTVTHLRLRQDEELPDSLQGYEAVFINLGNFGAAGDNYHQLTEAEGEILAGYIEDGGSLYMEGSDTWFRDPATDVHPYFMIEGLADGHPIEPPVIGQEGSLAEGLLFEGYQAPDNDYVDHLAASQGAVEVFTYSEGEESFLGMISYHGGEYRTVGCSFEFGGLVDGEGGTKRLLMRRIVDFFRLPPPEFLTPINLQATLGDRWITLSWEMPDGAEHARDRNGVVGLQHEIGRLASPRDETKPDRRARERIIELKRELSEMEENLQNRPGRDDLHLFNVYLDGELWEQTNSRRVTILELENGRPYQCAVTALYVQPEGESEPAGPITVVPAAAFTPVHSEDFEVSNGSLTAEPFEDGWEWGEPEMGAASGERAWGTRLDRPYPEMAEFYLYTPVIDLEDVGTAWFSFNHYLECERGFDGGRLEVSTDGGERWALVEPRGGYPYAGIFALDEGPGFTGVTDGWQPVTFDLADYTGQRILVRFVFKSDESWSFAGWFIDDIQLTSPALSNVRVSVLWDEIPIDTARVWFGDEYFGLTDSNGRIWFFGVQGGEYLIRVERIGYQPAERDVEVIGGQDAEFDIFLDEWDSRLEVDADELSDTLESGERVQVVVTMINSGRMETEFLIYIDYFSQNNLNDRWRDDPGRDEPWELLREYDLTAATGEQYFIGAQFIQEGSPEDYLLVAGAGDFGSGDSCRFYHFDREGRFVGDVPQDYSQIVGWGLRDLAYDGRYLYGSCNDRIYVMNPITGGRVMSMSGTELVINRAITYVPEDDAFWIGDRDDTWFKIDRQGDVLDRVAGFEHGLTGVMGMAWNPSDPDGAYLYIHNQESDVGGAAIYRFNPETRELVRQLETAAEDEGFPGGAFVTYLYDTHNYVLGVLIQGPEGDVVRLFELWPHRSWLAVEPVSGQLVGEDETELFVTFDAARLIDTILDANIEVHDLRAADVIVIPCRLEVIGGAAVVEGTVTVEAEPEVADSLIILVSLTLDGAVTNPDTMGFYRFDGLFPGEYVLQAELDGFIPFVSDLIELAPDDTTQVDPILTTLPFGWIEGQVTTVYDSVAAGVEISVVREDDERFYALDTTDTLGNYSLHLPEAVYRVAARLDGWWGPPEEGVEVVDAETTRVDFVLDDHLGVHSMRADGNFDDRIELFWLPPGTHGDIVTLQYDNDELAGGVNLINRDDVIATRFEPEGEYDILAVTIYIVTNDDMRRWGQDDLIDLNNPIYLKVFAEDPETGLPGELTLNQFVDEHYADVGWTTIYLDEIRFLEGPFFVGWSQHPERNRYERAGLDDGFDNAGTLFIRFDDVWRRYDDLPGDQMLRAVVWSHFEGEGIRLSPATGRTPRRIAAVERDGYADEVRLLNPAYPPITVSIDPFDWLEIYRRITFPGRDERLGYWVYVDGELANEEPIDVGVLQWVHVVGSEGEDQEHRYNVRAVYEDDELGDAEVRARANLPPGPVTDVTVVRDGMDFTVSWNPPDVNADGSECVDYDGCEIFINDEQAAVVDAPDTAWSSSVEEGEEGWYDIRLVAFDEVPNLSEPVDLTTSLGIALVYNFELGQDDAFVAEPEDELGWELTSDMDDGPGDAHSGRYAWITCPAVGFNDKRYEDNADWTLTTIDEFLVETESAELEFYHYMSTEPGHDGGQVLISVDGGDWELIEPEGGYPDRTVAAFRNRPGYTSDTGGWVLAGFDLAPYREHMVRLRFHFASDQTINWFPGWYIDDMVLWGCSLPELAELSGLVRDQNHRRIPGATVQAGRVIATSGQDGSYTLSGLMSGQVVVTASQPGYRDAEVEVELEPGQVVYQNLQLYRPRVEVDIAAFDFPLGGDDRLDANFTLDNRGSIDLPYWIRLVTTPVVMRDEVRGRSTRSVSGAGPGRDDPWDVVFDYNLTEITGYERIMGAEYAEGRFYLTSGDADHGATVLVLDWDGQLQRAFRQPLEAVGWGLRDLAWDGELLYGSQDGNIYSFTLDGETAGQQAGAPLTANRALAYDPEADGFWAAEWDSPWYLVDRDEQVQFQWDGHGLTGVYGMACRPFEPDGMPLYVFNREDDGTTGIYRADPREGNIERVHQYDGAPTGCFITGSWDANRWIIGGIVGSSPQRLVGFEIGRRAGWLSCEPISGQLEPREAVDITISINIPPDAAEEDDYSAELSVMAFGGEQAVASLEVEIVEGFRHFDPPEETDFYMTFEIESAEIEGVEISVGSEIAVVTPRGEIGGAVRWVSPPAEFRGYIADGAFRIGEPFEFIIWDGLEDHEYTADAEIVEGPSRFRIGERSVVRLAVVPPDTQTVPLEESWNLVSIYVQPSELDVTQILSEVDQRGNLVLVKDGLGRFWFPRFGYVGLGEWDLLAAYMIYVIEDDSFTVNGVKAPPDTPIFLRERWNSVGYLLDHPVDARVALEGILDVLVIAKNGYGDFMAPEHNYYGLGDMLPGQGFKINVSQEIDLVYNPGDELAVVREPSQPPLTIRTAPTGSDMSLLITALHRTCFRSGAEVVVLAGAERFPAGSILLDAADAGPYGIIIRGDDPMTPERDGAAEGDVLSLVVRYSGEEMIPEAEVLHGELTYSTDGFTVVELSSPVRAVPTGFVIDRIYPNPFNSRIRLSFGLPEAAGVELTVRDIRGRKVFELPVRGFPAGWHSYGIDASLWSSGIYLLELATPERRIVRKLALIR